MADLHPRSNGTRPSPIAATEVAATRKPTEGASLLPPRVYHDPEILTTSSRSGSPRAGSSSGGKRRSSCPASIS